MSVRLSLAAVAALLGGTLFVVGCTQGSSPGNPSSPITPSSPTLPSVSGGTVQPRSISDAPVFAQLNIVNNFLVSANQQLTLFFVPPNPTIPPNPIVPPRWDQNALNFYLQANVVLDAVPPNPISPVDALDAIIGQANITLNLIATHVVPPNPIIPQLVTQANHTISAATALKQTCDPGQDICGG